MRVLSVGVVILLANAIAPLLGDDVMRAPVPHAPIAEGSHASAQVADSIEAQLFKDGTAFFIIWDKWWRYSQSHEWQTADGQKFMTPIKQGLLRSSFQHCHTRESATHDPLVSLTGEYGAISSATSAFAICPSWSLGGTKKFIDGAIADENEDADAAINPLVLPLVRAARAKLLESHAQALRALPTNASIVGQYVRLLLDQGLFDSAQSATRSCQADLWWCQLLRGYVDARRHDPTHASFVFDSAYQSMPENERCIWFDIAPLLPGSRQQAFESQSCAERLLASNRFWWLSDPMFSQPGNERRAEHMARNVRLTLLTSMPTDGRFQYWNRLIPTDALRKLVLRYGWPTYLGWGGDGIDSDHDRWLLGFNNAPHGPYTTYEYSGGRVHTAAKWSAFDAPFAATDSSWELNSDAPLDHPERWWPTEHMQRTRKLAVIPEGQIALLRRANDVLLATSHNLNASSLDAISDGTSAMFMLSPAPDSIAVLSTQPITRSTTLHMESRIPSAPALLALEVSDASSNGIDARTRRGISPPVTLSAMKPGDVALSDPVILRMASSDKELSSPSEALLTRMVGSTTISLASLSRLGVYWESYGFREQDTVSVSVRIERRETLSAFRRIRMALKVANDPNSSVSITWREPDRTRITRPVDGPVPIQVRTVLLDISNLQPGPYDLITEMSKGSNVVASSSRRILVVR